MILEFNTLLSKTSSPPSYHPPGPNVESIPQGPFSSCSWLGVVMLMAGCSSLRHTKWTVNCDSSQYHHSEHVFGGSKTPKIITWVQRGPEIGGGTVGSESCPDI